MPGPPKGVEEGGDMRGDVRTRRYKRRVILSTAFILLRRERGEEI